MDPLWSSQTSILGLHLHDYILSEIHTLPSDLHEEGILSIKEMLAVHKLPHDLPHNRFTV